MEQRELFHVREPLDAGLREDTSSVCRVLMCQSGQCGVLRDGCGGTIDCGPCTDAPCPDELSVLKRNLHDTQKLVHQDGALFYTTERGSTPVHEWKESDPDQDAKVGVGAVKQLRVDDHYIYILSRYSVGRVVRPFKSDASRSSGSIRFAQDNVSTASFALEQGDVWVVIKESQGAALMRASQEDFEKKPDLTRAQRIAEVQGEAQARSLLVLHEGLYWVMHQPEREVWQLVYQDVAVENPLEVVLDVKDPIAWLTVFGERLVYETRNEQETVLWSKESKDAPPFAIKRWSAGVEVLDLDVLNPTRGLITRQAVDSEGKRQGWLVSTLDFEDGREDVLTTFTREISSVPQGVATDGTCVYVAYRDPQIQPINDQCSVGWFRVNTPPK